MAKAKPKSDRVEKTVAQKSTAKKSVAKKKAASPSVSSLETKLAKMDRELVKCLNERVSLACRIGKVKHEAGKLAFLATDDDAVLERVVAKNKGPLEDATLRAVFRELTSGSRALVRQLRIAILGPLYSYSHLAALHRFGQTVEFVPVGSIGAVFEEVIQNHADYGLVPIENSTDGRIADTLDMFTKLPVRICGEVEFPIHHTLLGKCARSDIKEVYSKPQALSQCRNWMAKHLPGARPVEVTSTTAAAELAGERSGSAAIASIQAGVHYGLDILAEKIEDNPDNTTRFSVIGEHSADRTGNDKTAIMFQMDNRPGALAEALGIFKRNRVNLTWIESFPFQNTDRAYLFFMEMGGHETDTRVRRAVASLEKKSLRLSILGSFPVSPPAD